LLIFIGLFLLRIRTCRVDREKSRVGSLVREEGDVPGA
jgi:hypothetical protein